jgi:hypothetical protein
MRSASAIGPQDREVHGLREPGHLQLERFWDTGEKDPEHDRARLEPSLDGPLRGFVVLPHRDEMAVRQHSASLIE